MNDWFEVFKRLYEKRFNFYGIYDWLDRRSLNNLPSLDTNDFDISFVRGLSLEDGAATLTEFTARIIISAIKETDRYKEKIILCGGGRKNKFLINTFGFLDLISLNVFIASINNKVSPALTCCPILTYAAESGSADK